MIRRAAPAYVRSTESNLFVSYPKMRLTPRTCHQHISSLTFVTNALNKKLVGLRCLKIQIFKFKKDQTKLRFDFLLVNWLLKFGIFSLKFLDLKLNRERTTWLRRKGDKGKDVHYSQSKWYLTLFQSVYFPI